MARQGEWPGLPAGLQRAERRAQRAIEASSGSQIRLAERSVGVSAEREWTTCVTQGYPLGPQYINSPVSTSLARDPPVCITVDHGKTRINRLDGVQPAPQHANEWAPLKPHELTHLCACTASKARAAPAFVLTWCCIHLADLVLHPSCGGSPRRATDGHSYDVRFKLITQIVVGSVDDLLAARPDALE